MARRGRPPDPFARYQGVFVRFSDTEWGALSNPPLDSAEPPCKSAARCPSANTMKRSRGWLFSAVATMLFSLSLCLVPARAAAPQDSPQVSYRNGRLSVTAEGVPLRDVLHGVAGATGLEITGLEALSEPVTISLTAVPLREGLRRLLARLNYVLLEEPGREQSTRPIRVLIFAPGGPAPIGSTPPAVRRIPPRVEAAADPASAAAESIEELRPYGMTAFSDEEEAKTPEEEGAALQ
jgi:hypothetical protein